MHIESADRRLVLEVKRNQNGGHASFDLACTVTFGHGSASARNSDVHFQDLFEFIQSLDRFLLDRSLEPTLNGTYETYLKFSKMPNRNLVSLAFAIGDAFAGGHALSTFRLEGCFEIDQDRLNSIREELSALAADA